jgi:hypothetical protein
MLNMDASRTLEEHQVVLRHVEMDSIWEDCNVMMAMFPQEMGNYFSITINKFY